ncbi:MAG: histidine ammonia-lyase [Chitinophagales bacterium]
MQQTFKYGKETLTYEKAMQLANGLLEGIIDQDTTAKIEASAALTQKLAEGNQAVYGINTGFGPLCTTKIAGKDTAQLQHNLLMSHSVGIGENVPIVISKLMLVTKLQALSQGYSGIQLDTLKRIQWLLKEGIIPVVPSKGSVGASGDLAPLSHLFLPLIGLGKVWFNNEIYDTSVVLEQKEVEPLTLRPKEALALINGTQFIASYAVLFLHTFHNILELADVISALSLEGFQGSVNPFTQALHDLRPFEGNLLVAKRMRNLLEGSDIVTSHKNCDRVQDPYSIRCIPAVHGASRNAWKHLKEITEIELNAVTDNPIILEDGQSISGGNFHGQPLAIPLDYACVAAAEIGSISERRSYLMLEGKFGLPTMLIKDGGLHSGFMIPQYTAAALVSENKGLCFPASCDSIPTSLGQEDHVSMGSISGRKAQQVAQNVTFILAIELLYALQAIDYRRPSTSSELLEKVHSFLREKIDHVESDRIFSDDINILQQLIVDGTLLNLVNRQALLLNVELN